MYYAFIICLFWYTDTFIQQMNMDSLFSGLPSYRYWRYSSEQDREVLRLMEPILWRGKDSKLFIQSIWEISIEMIYKCKECQPVKFHGIKVIIQGFYAEIKRNLPFCIQKTKFPHRNEGSCGKNRSNGAEAPKTLPPGGSCRQSALRNRLVTDEECGR